MNEKNQKEMKLFEGKSILKDLEKLKKVKELQDQEGRTLHFPKYPNEIKRDEGK
ncbi:hypothetical protein [Bacillus pseudomycoides]|uniref:hypothetical protein n=1 Tax=Bacillus pseudomycoides TaxID=64104 RepID=UPI000B0AD755|nr:hypothetical protein [Bacillus pseudomycoides]MED0855704.1 hypothetical protein [Bacillus pseudomycoides]